MKGKIKFYNETKGYGFIKSDEDGKEYFFHATGLIDQVKEGDNVSFELIDGKKGLNASEVSLNQPI